MKRTFLLLICVFFMKQLYAQTVVFDSVPRMQREYRYVGIQGNLLLQQFISFNSNSSINSNPYVFSYSKNDAFTGKGTNFGSGFNISEVSNNDGVAATEFQNINVTFRYGFERKYLQKEKFIPFWGMDVGIGGVYTKLTSRLTQSFTNNTTVVETTKFFLGPAVRGGVLYALSKNVMLGTEFFFNAQVAYSNTNSPGITSNRILPFNIGFQVPTALFLTFRY